MSDHAERVLKYLDKIHHGCADAIACANNDHNALRSLAREVEALRQALKAIGEIQRLDTNHPTGRWLRDICGGFENPEEPRARCAICGVLALSALNTEEPK